MALGSSFEKVLTTGGASLLHFDSVAYTYVGVTNNRATAVYKLRGTTVATVTYTYVAAGVADDDDILTETVAFA